MTTALLAQASRRFLSRSVGFSKPKIVNNLQKPCHISFNEKRHSSALAAAFAAKGDSSDPKSSNHPWPKVMALLAGSAVVGNAFREQNMKTDCCGIAGVIGTSNLDAR